MQSSGACPCNRRIVTLTVAALIGSTIWVFDDSTCALGDQYLIRQAWWLESQELTLRGSKFLVVQDTSCMKFGQLVDLCKEVHLI